MKFLIIAALITAVVANDVIHGEWIVTIKRGAKQAALSRKLRNDFALHVQKHFNFSNVTMMHVKGSNAAISRARKLPEFLSVEPNQLFYATQTCSVTSHPGVWGLDRIDQRAKLPYTSPSDPSATYDSSDQAGSGTTAYVLDTGIRISHEEFGGRATWGYSAGILPHEDDNGHGTHVAGTIGSKAYGVAKGVNLVACKCIDYTGAGSTDNIIECINWSAEQGADTINLSMGGGVSNALDDAVDAVVAKGITVVCAAGNSDADACGSSPGREPSCITVGATEVDDQSASYTNYGSCIDVFAPGADILSTWHLSDSFAHRMSGTSMAAPHVTGVCNSYISSRKPTFGSPSPSEVAGVITSTATPNIINFRPAHGSSPNLLLFTSCQ